MTTTSEAGVSLTRAREAPSTVWVWSAFLVALLALAGSLYLSLGMQRKACALCFYQRTFAMSLVAVLGMGLLVRLGAPGRLSLLALPLAAAGLGVALFHVSLEMRGKLECPAGVFGWGTAPQQSLAVFAVIFGLVFMGAVRGQPMNANVGTALMGALMLGGLLAYLSSISNPSPPAAPPGGYKEAVPDICRPPYHPAP